MRNTPYSDFEIVQEIGAGTVGTIYRALRKRDQKEFALKLLAQQVTRDPLVVARFEREVLILSKLNHPNIVSYEGHGRIQGQLFYVMELIRGGTLKSILEQSGSLTWQEAAECGVQLASALQHAHNFGIIHRDIKPGNVYVTEEGVLKLGDFGIARDLKSNELTEVGLTVGTYAYMPPEMVRGERNISGKVDLYALGCLLFEMMTGSTPFTGDHFAEIFDQHLHSPPPRIQNVVAEIPDDLDTLIAELLAKDPEHRPFNARTVQGRLGELIDRETESSPEDRGAGTIRSGSLAERLAQREPTPEVGWRSLVFTVLALIVCLALIRMLAG